MNGDRTTLAVLRVVVAVFAAWGALAYAVLDFSSPALGLVGAIAFGVGVWLALPLVVGFVSHANQDTHAPTPDERARGIGAGVIAGSVRGATAALLTFGAVALAFQLPLLAVALLFLGPPLSVFWLEWRNPSLASLWLLRSLSQGWILLWGPVFLFMSVYLGRRIEELLDFDRDLWPRLLGLSVLAGAAISACEAASSRARGPIARAALRSLAGLAAPAAALGLLVTLGAIHSKTDPLFATTFAFSKLPEATFALVPLGLAIAAGELVAGTPFPGASREARIRRGARLAAGAGFVLGMFAIPLLSYERRNWFMYLEFKLPPLTFPFTWVASSVVVSGIVAAHSLALVVARPVALRVARRVEPGQAWLDRRERARAHDRQAQAAELALRAGKVDEALTAARQALELSLEDPWLSAERREDARRLFEIVLEEERFDEVEKLPRGIAELPILVAELRRVREGPDAAIAHVRGLLERRELALPLVASAHAILALAHADRGERELAAAELAGLRVASFLHGPLLARHGVARVAGYLEFRTRGAERS